MIQPVGSIHGINYMLYKSVQVSNNCVIIYDFHQRSKMRTHPCKGATVDDVFVEHRLEGQPEQNVVLHSAAHDPGFLRGVADTSHHVLGALDNDHLVTQTVQQRRLKQ